MQSVIDKISPTNGLVNLFLYLFIYIVLIQSMRPLMDSNPDEKFPASVLIHFNNKIRIMES